MDIECAHLRDRRVAASDAWRGGSRGANPIRAIVLHQTSGNPFLPGSRRAYPSNPDSDRHVRSDHAVDDIRAHFVVIADGTIFYTHDVDRRSGSAGGDIGIDIEFAGSYSASHRLPITAILSGRRLVKTLVYRIGTIRFVHPHGQIQGFIGRGDDMVACGGDTGIGCGKVDSCPGPDVWMNVGEWAARRFALATDSPLPYYRNNNGISDRQRDGSFDRQMP